MRRPPLVLAAVVCALALAATAVAADPTGFFSQTPGHGGCLTDDGTSNGAAADCADGRGLLGVNAIALTPSGKFAYAYGYAGSIAIFSRDATTGALTQAADTGACISSAGSGGDCEDGRMPSSGADSAHAIAISGNTVYTVGRDDELVSVFTRDPASGALTELSGTAGCSSSTGNDADGVGTCATTPQFTLPQSIAVSPDGKFLYVGGYGDVGLTAFSIGVSGELTMLSGDDGCHVAAAISGCTTSRLAKRFYDIALSPDGSTLYGVDIDDSAVVAFSRDDTSGVLTQISGEGGCVVDDGVGDAGDPCTQGRGLASPQSVEVSPDGKLVSVGAGGEQGIAILHRASDGTLSQSGGAAGCVNETTVNGCGTSRTTENIYGMRFSPDSGTLITAGQGDTAGASGIGFFDVASDGTPTQRPGTRGCISESGADHTGTAGTCAAARGVVGPNGLTMTGDGKQLYVASYRDNGVTAFRLEHPPACSDATGSTAFGAPVAVPVACTDSDGDPVTLAGVDGPAHGGATFSGLLATFTPAAGFSGADSFRVKGSDGIADSTPATVSITVGAPPSQNPPPPGGTTKATPPKLSVGAKPKRDRKLPYRFTFSGALTPAAGTTCSGSVVVTVKRGSKTVAKKTAALSSACRWKAVVTFKNRKKLGKKRSGKLVAKARFGGNAALNAKSSSALTVRYG